MGVCVSVQQQEEERYSSNLSPEELDKVNELMMKIKKSTERYKERFLHCHVCKKDYMHKQVFERIFDHDQVYENRIYACGNCLALADKAH